MAKNTIRSNGKTQPKTLSIPAGKTSLSHPSL